MKVLTYLALIACTQAVSLREDPLDAKLMATVGKTEFDAIKNKEANKNKVEGAEA